MEKFLRAWEQYASQIKDVSPQKPVEMKRKLANQDFEDVVREKFSQEQVQTLKEFKDMIYESEKRKKEGKSV